MTATSSSSLIGMSGTRLVMQVRPIISYIRNKVSDISEIIAVLSSRDLRFLSD